MATGEYGNLIKEEVKSALEEHISNAPEIVISKMEFQSENIKSEDVIDVVHHVLKSEKCEVCGGLLCTTDFVSPDSLDSICNCLYQNESNAMQDEDMTWDFKPFNIDADSRNFHFKIQEETLVVKEKEVDNENVPSASCENKISIEKFRVVKHKTLQKTEEVDETFSNSTNFSFIIQEEKLVVKEEEVDNENVPSMSCENKISLEKFHVVKHKTLQKSEEVDETFRSGYDLNSVGKRIQEENEMYSKNLNERTDIGNRPIKKIFNCKVCKKSYAQSCDLKRHEITHTGEKPFQCEICSKFFTRKDNLTSHERTHTGEKPFQCKICSKFFTRKDSLTSHEKIHTGEKPFQCKICSKSFIQRSNWKSHEKNHTGEKPFQCKICSKSYTQRSVLKLHKKIHTGEKNIFDSP
ncbi:uncharacterized protein isoform X2 [Leptinotarsa decemlineata]|uniref:uncharacterized protein isoform X2 n=1 Tax=Leptinotarsa decemlineata TaxID=7539 RepID=UPI003D308605